MSAVLSGGDKLDKLLKELGSKADAAADKTVRVGFLEGATYPDGTSVAAVATWQEFGTRSIPSRPFFRNMIRNHSGQWAATAADLLKKNNYDFVRVLNLMGMGMKAQLQQSIIDITSPPLSAITLMLRKMRAEEPDLHVTGATVGEAARRVAAGRSYAGVSTKPLVDTGHLLNSVDYEVKG